MHEAAKRLGTAAYMSTAPYLALHQELQRHSMQSLAMVGTVDNCLDLSCKGHLGFKAS